MARERVSPCTTCTSWPKTKCSVVNVPAASSNALEVQLEFKGIGRPEHLEAHEIVARVTIELGPAVLGGSGSLAERVRREAGATKIPALRAPLSSLAEKLESIERSNDPNRASVLAAIEKAGRLSCEYFGCGSCGDGAQVCCYYDGTSPPVCWCESC